MIRDREEGWPEARQQLRQGRDLADRGEPHPEESFGSFANSHPGGFDVFLLIGPPQFSQHLECPWWVGWAEGLCSKATVAFLAKGFTDFVHLSVLGRGEHVEAPQPEV